MFNREQCGKGIPFREQPFNATRGVGDTEGAADFFLAMLVSYDCCLRGGANILMETEIV